MKEINRQYWCHFDGKYTEVKPLDDLVKGIKAHIDSVEKRNTYLEEENKRLKDEHYKDNTIADLQKQVAKADDALYRGFPISQKEMENINAWIQSHEEKKAWRKLF